MGFKKSKEEKDLKKFTAKVQAEHDAIQNRRTDLVDSIINEMLEEKIDQSEATRQSVLVMNYIEFQTATQFSQEDSPSAN